MALQKAPFWTDLYYKIVEYYFWSPQVIGRISNPAKSAKPWRHWRNSLSSQETPLNHIIDFLFHIAPDEFLDAIIASLLGREAKGFSLVEPSPGTLDASIVQPDMILCNQKELVFVEMKVDSQSSVDQFIKYAIASACIRAQDPLIRSTDLVMLTRKAHHSYVWKNAARLGIGSEESLKSTAKIAVYEESILCQRGVQKYFRANPNAKEEIVSQLDRIRLHMVDYSVLKNAMTAYISREKSLSNLINGVIEELGRRSLTPTVPSEPD